LKDQDWKFYLQNIFNRGQISNHAKSAGTGRIPAQHVKKWREALKTKVKAFQLPVFVFLCNNLSDGMIRFEILIQIEIVFISTNL